MSTIVQVRGVALPRQFAVAAHLPCHLLQPFQGKWRGRNWLHGQRHELHGIVIGGDAIGAQRAADFTAMNDGPLSVLPHPDSDGLHDAATMGRAVSRLYVQMLAGEAIGAVISMSTACAVWEHSSATHLADKGLCTGMGLVIAFVE